MKAFIAALLTATMILLFLGSWRSTLIVVRLDSAVHPHVAYRSGLLGETINVMTLGGLALAVGILVDDATVEIENIHRNMGSGSDPAGDSRRRAADRRAGVCFDHCICIVFVPVLMLTGAAKFLFTPLAWRSCSRCSRRTCSRARWCR